MLTNTISKVNPAKMHLFYGILPDNRGHSIQSDILFERVIKAEMNNGSPAKP